MFEKRSKSFAMSDGEQFPPLLIFHGRRDIEHIR